RLRPADRGGVAAAARRHRQRPHGRGRPPGEGPQGPAGAAVAAAAGGAPGLLAGPPPVAVAVPGPGPAAAAQRDERAEDVSAAGRGPGAAEAGDAAHAAAL